MNKVQKQAAKRPTGLAGILAPAGVIIAKKLGVELSVEEAVILIGAIVGTVSFFSPRTTE